VGGGASRVPRPKLKVTSARVQRSPVVRARMASTGYLLHRLGPLTGGLSAPITCAPTMKRHLLVTYLAASSAACGPDALDRTLPSLETPEVGAALDVPDPVSIEHHIRVLADDSLAGRAPGTEGFEAASRYVEGVLRSLGLAPAGVDGTYRQPVPLLRSTVDEAGSSMSVLRSGTVTDLVYGVDFWLSPDATRAEATVTAPVAFVGYGVSAPGLGYDDYDGIEVSGKIVAMLSGAPPSFPSDERAYYSSGSVKASEAARRGAVGSITFTAPDDPRFRWEVSVARATGGSFTWLDAAGRPRDGESPIRGAASLNHSGVATLFAGAPAPLDTVFARAAASTPQAFDLPAQVTMKTVSAHRRVGSHNVVARLEGSDERLREENIVYVAHVDHLGTGVPIDGDSIYNGAHDNASGVAILLEVARAFASLPTPPRRSVIFLIATGEEWGLLGSDYFARNPTVPGSSLVAALSLDMPFLFHPLLDIVPYGADHSSLSDAVGAAAARLALDLGPDPIPEQVLFIRSDHFSFIRQGIPALFIKSGFRTGSPDRDGAEINAAWRRDVYHTPRDDADQAFDFVAGVTHAQVNFLTGYRVAMQGPRPTWNRGDFFGGLFAR
jgi:hypothetical protein